MTALKTYTNNIILIWLYVLGTGLYVLKMIRLKYVYALKIISNVLSHKGAYYHLFYF